jgi:hypothetical protein
MKSLPQLHLYIIGWMSLLIAFGITLFWAMNRVSQTEKFTAQPFNSLTCAGQSPGDRTIVTFQTCAQMQVKPLPPKPESIHTQFDPFAEAFRHATQATANGKVAKTSTDWRIVAGQWQQAAELMKQVKPEDQRFTTAQDRIKLYKNNYQIVLRRSERNSRG